MQTSRSAIEALWLGEICPGEDPTKNTNEINEIIKSIKENKEGLKKLLNEEQNAILNELLTDLDFLYLLRRSEEFKKGFSLASKLLAEAFLSE